MERAYPKVNYIGNKEKISEWISQFIPKDATSLLDAFSGGASVAYMAKKRGLTVYTNDILSINYHISKALIENSKDILTEEDVEKIFEGSPIEGFMYNNYSNVYYFPEECKELDLYRSNIEKLSSDFKKSLALSLMRRSMIRKMPYSRFNIKWDKITQLRNEDYSYSVYKRKRAYHNKSFKFHFLENLKEYNNAVFDNGKHNRAYNSDVFDILPQSKADIVYLDPPYTGTMCNYYAFYGILDEYVVSHKIDVFTNNFMDKKQAIYIFNKLFSSLANYRYWLLSYSSLSYPSKETLVEILRQYSDDIVVHEKPHSYKVTGKQKKRKNIEYLFIIKNRNHGADL